MSSDPTKEDAKEPVSLAGRIDQACDRFEAAWRSDRRPRIEDYLNAVSQAEQGQLLRELLAVELELRRRKQQRPTADEYRKRFPEYQEQVETAFALTSKSSVEETCAPAAESDAAQTEALRVRCPHCSAAVEIVDETPLVEIGCSNCGSSFDLVGDGALAYESLGGTIRRRRVFGHFELIEQLGVGAFGAVWKARDTKLDRTVAVKIPRKGELTQAETEKVLREARATAQLRHPHIVSVHEVGVEEGLIYTVSEFVDGLTLHDRLTGQRFTADEAAELCATVAEAIHFAHQHGVIHRDLKPSNIILDESSKPHIVDFGLAKRETGEITMTTEGQVLGTPAYMSPEQAKGESHQADCRTDVYSLGVILFELLTGERPFRGNMRMVLKQVVEDEPPSPRKLGNRIPRDLETVCLKCLEKEPNRRYQTAAELMEDLNRYSSGQPVLARPVGAIGRLWRWYRCNPDATIRVAGGYMTAVSIVLLIWGLEGLLIFGLGIDAGVDAGRAACEVVLVMLAVYLPMLWTGIRALNGHAGLLWVGLVISFLGLLLTISGLLGVTVFAGLVFDLHFRMALFSLLANLTFLGVLVHATAIICHHARKDS